MHLHFRSFARTHITHITLCYCYKAYRDSLRKIAQFIKGLLHSLKTRLFCEDITII